MIEVTIYSRSNCHLCDVALGVLEEFRQEFNFQIVKILIDKSPELEEKYGEQVPVIMIDGEIHDFFKLNEARFRKALTS